MDLKTAEAHALSWADREDRGTALAVSTAHEGPDAWLIVLDARAHVTDGDPWAFLMDAPTILVNKETGTVEEVGWERGQELAGAMESRYEAVS